MKLTSPAFKDGKDIPPRYTCEGTAGGGAHPPLSIEGVPEEAHSLLLFLEELSADLEPHGTNLLYWSLWNIPPETRGIAEGETPPQAVEGMTHFGTRHYEPPCPPQGETRYYRFRLFALSKSINIDPAHADLERLEEAIVGHILAEAELVGKVTRV